MRLGGWLSGSLLLATTRLASNTPQVTLATEAMNRAFSVSAASSTCSSMTSLTKRIKQWSFAESKLCTLPLDSETENFVRRHVPKAIFSLCQPTPLKTERKLVAANDDVLIDILDMDPAIKHDPDFVDFVSGNLILPSSKPLSHRYGGFQFGSWASQLGDGRAHILGEYVNRNGEHWELQLKGSGKTPYSRFGDGRAVLRSSVREFLCSEAMHYLGVPTSRAAALIVSDDPVPRDKFYDGNMKMERAAVVLRLAPTWFRFGSFEILSKNAEIEEMRQLAEFILRDHFPHIVTAHAGDFGAQILALLAEVTRDTAEMSARWMSVGFTHGVMNTDNMSIKSVTIDYGPFGFLDTYDPHFIPNTSDDMGRYDLQNQPSVALWNLQRLSSCLAKFIKEDKLDSILEILQGFEKIYQGIFTELFIKKLGLKSVDEQEDDLKLLALLLDSMERKGADFTQTFRDIVELSLDDLEAGKIPESAWGLQKIKDDATFQTFMQRYCERARRDTATDDTERMEIGQKANPRYVLRNWMAQNAIEKAENDDFSEVERLLRVLKKPFNIQPEAEAAGYAKPPPQWAHRVMVSCSS